MKNNTVVTPETVKQCTQSSTKNVDNVALISPTPPTGELPLIESRRLLLWTGRRLMSISLWRQSDVDCFTR